jgi:LacI family transcriptional regulator
MTTLSVNVVINIIRCAMVTIKDVARHSGVSIKTVSRVVNNLAEVSSETRQKVQQVILELGYQPNATARNLVNGKTNTVGVIIPHSADYIFTHSFFTQVLRGIAEVLSANNFDMHLHLAHDNEPYASLYSQRKVDGLILMSIPIGDPGIKGLDKSGAPCVFTCRLSDAGESDISFVDADFEGGVGLAMDHLISLGHRRIGLLTGAENLVSVKLRKQGYLKALKKNDIPVIEGYVLAGDFTSESGYDLALQIMQHPSPPSALVCGDDMMAFGAIKAVTELGYCVPKDISIVGFDDINLSQFSTPQLTTIRQEKYQKGRIAAETLLTLIQNKDNGPQRQIITETSLIVRASTAPAQIRSEGLGKEVGSE